MKKVLAVLVVATICMGLCGCDGNAGQGSASVEPSASATATASAAASASTSASGASSATTSSGTSTGNIGATREALAEQLETAKNSLSQSIELFKQYFETTGTQDTDGIVSQFEKSRDELDSLITEVMGASSQADLDAIAEHADQISSDLQAANSKMMELIASQAQAE